MRLSNDHLSPLHWAISSGMPSSMLKQRYERVCLVRKFRDLDVCLDDPADNASRF